MYVLPLSTVYLLRCDFETYDAASTMCGMQQDRRDDFDWTLWSGPTPSQQTGPSAAYSGAFYMYTEASSPRRKGDKARCGITLHGCNATFNNSRFDESVLICPKFKLVNAKQVGFNKSSQVK